MRYAMPMDIDQAAMVAVGLQLVYAVVILAVGMWAAFAVSKVIRRQALKRDRVDTTLGNFIADIVRYILMAIVLIAVLQRFGVQTASLVAVLGAATLAIGLALQGTLSNVAGGVMIIFLRPYRIGDYVLIAGAEGIVEDVNIFFTTLRSLESSGILVPNREIWTTPMTNFSIEGRKRCVIVFSVGYEDDLDHVLAVLRREMTDDPRAMAEPEPWFGVVAHADSAVNVSTRVWTATADYWAYRTDMLKRVKQAFDREGIDIPYPHSVEIEKRPDARAS
jgi:small conductance mechanosensitive channel